MTLLYKLCTVLLFFILCLLSNAAFANDLAFNKAQITGNFSNFAKEIDSHLTARSRNLKKSGSSYLIPEIKLNANLRGLGRAKIKLNKRRIQGSGKSGFSNAYGFTADSKKVTLFKGTVDTAEGIFPASAAVFLNRNNERVLRINLSGKRIGRSRMNAYTLNINLDNFRNNKLAKVSKTPFLENLACGSDAPAPIRSATHRNLSLNFSSAASEVSAAADFKVLEVGAYADAEWFGRFGSDSNAEMIAVINSAEAIYESQLSMTFEIVSTTTFTSNPTGLGVTDASTLLGNFGTYILNNNLGPSADIHHLLSGKDFDGSTAGVAWLGTVCESNFPYYKTGINQFLNSNLTYLVFAHELGHNFDADHDSVTTPRTIMFPSIGSTQTQFSSTSLNAMNTYIATYGSCLSTTSLTPTPVSTNTPVSTPSTPTPIVNPPISNTPMATPFIPAKLYKVNGKVSFGKSAQNKKAAKYKPRVIFTNSSTGISSAKNLNSNLQFGVKLANVTHTVLIELKLNGAKEQFVVGEYTVIPKVNNVIIKLPPSLLTQSIKRLHRKYR